ncbi:MAG: tRNA (N(6)-L-threonylcarbamoyladenosine(37)-C(2))-methylthiotransferase MtaB [Clostridiales bacterium]|nr:tRNA (N(6)-L-threonylcarbamoyladenosine(37)-C(2))-methylthiotransferase MtaB [Clostridiales bacterium]
MKKVASFALGCKVNQYESEAISELFQQKGYEIVGIDDKADVYVINTCSVTNLGDKKSRQLIRKVRRQNPAAIVVAAGCYAQVAPQELEKIEGINLILGTKGRKEIVDLVENYHKEAGIGCYVGDIRHETEFEHLSVQSLRNRTRAYLKIQDGCNQYCSYCIIPYARGPVRSRDPEDIIKEVQVLAENGFKEIVLTGIHVASYGKDLDQMNLLSIIEQVHQVEGIERIRFSSIEPNIITEEFIEGLKYLPKVCSHFHLSLQSGCDKTLKEMNRKYTTERYRQAVQMLRDFRKDVAVTTDIIVGFPGETEEDFEQCRSFAEEINFAKIHVFPYSPKKGTPAAVRKDQVDGETKTKRSKILLEVSDKSKEKFMKKLQGHKHLVLFEQEITPGIYEGYTSNYMRVLARSTKEIGNHILPVQIGEMEGDSLWGDIL